MHQPLISVIVPVYNVEAYLEQCVSSIVNQTYQNLEIILVDDGSTDRSGIMCDEWSKKDDRIRVIHKANGGLSDARNAGMKIANGEYVGFVDSDDYVTSDMFELLYNGIINTNSDISVCGIMLFWSDGTEKLLTPCGDYILNREDALEAIINETKLKQPACSKLYKATIIKDIYFPKGKCHEDVFWTYKAIGNAKHISIFEKPCYMYRQHSNSIMGTKYSLKRLDTLEAKLERLEYIEKECSSLFDLAKTNYWFSCIYSMQMVSKYCNTQDIKEAKRITSKYLKLYPIKSVFSVNVTPKQRIWLIIARISFSLCYKLRNLFGIGF